MFTGIVEALGIIKSFQKSGNGAVMTVHAPGLDFSDVKIGDSIACNGVCVTVTSFTRDTFTADLSLETLSCTSFKKAAPGKVINLEKAMSLSGRMGGHIVQGHVDAIGEILSITAKGEVREVWITLDENIARYIVHKGSVTVDGISLTVNEVLPDRFRLTLIPHTGSVTTVSTWVPGMIVNLEADILGRYVERLLFCKDGVSKVSGSYRKSGKSGITEEFLLGNGFI
ncbi:riboflavin synthase [Succinimonas amylolytica]|uniref:riboflavin synthase n=1 Tax=Succinimonas amylolytica TaxID=83769 RepID=UPI0023A90A78